MQGVTVSPARCQRETTSVVKCLRLCQTGEVLASTVQESDDGLSSSSLPCENPNPFPAGALQQNQQDALIPPSTLSAVRPNVTVQEISFWTMSPADDLSEASCHDAEHFSRKVLYVRGVPVRKDIECLFDLLPPEKPSRGNGQGCSSAAACLFRDCFVAYEWEAVVFLCHARS